MSRTFAVSLVGLIALPYLLFSAPPSHYPHYLHALSDLRYARFLLNRPDEHQVRTDQKEATYRIDRAIAEIKRAAMDEHKSLATRSEPNRSFQEPGRLSQAAELLESAMRDLNYEDGDFAASGWRVQAVKHIQDALELTRKAMIDKPVDHRH